MSIIKLFYDVETTGTNPKRHSIHQLSGLVEVDGEIVEEFNLKLCPHPKAEILPEALAIAKVTKEQILFYPEHKKGYYDFVAMIEQYVDKYDKRSKIYLVGFNNRKFDDLFLLSLFLQCGDQYFWSWFWADSLDVLVLAAQYLIDRRASMPSFKLHRVATELGIVVDKARLHDAKYDINLTRQIYRIVTGIDIEL